MQHKQEALISKINAYHMKKGHKACSRQKQKILLFGPLNSPYKKMNIDVLEDLNGRQLKIW